MSRKSSFGIGQLSRKWLNLAHRSGSWRLHNGANIYHPATLRLNSDRQRKYPLPGFAACVMYDAAKLRAIGGFSFGSNFQNTAARMSLSNFASWHATAVVLSPGSATKNCLQQLLTAAWLQTTHSVGFSAVLNTWDQSYLGHSDRGKLWVLGVCGTGLPNHLDQADPASPNYYYHSCFLEG